ncbi:MAG: ADP-glyceromanno-heptose 6-epimerase [bacterium]
MFVVTGGAGFIGSALIYQLNNRGHGEILAVDSFEQGEKWQNLRNLELMDYMDKEDFRERINSNSLPCQPEAIFHLGACSATTETDMGYLMDNNYNYTRQLAAYSLENDIRFIYASSAATYGDGSKGYSDDHELLPELQPLNKYAYSKYLFDLYARKQGWLDRLVGLKYFNVYGPNEYHKGEMRSVVHKSFEQVRDDGEVRLFKSHRPDYEDGQQKRDFLYVKDAVKMTLFFLDNPGLSGIFNIGRGKARPFADLGGGVVETMKNSSRADTTGEERINYIDMPEELRERYQYFTEADISKLRNAGYEEEIYTLEEGIKDYLENYLLTDDPYLEP